MAIAWLANMVAATMNPVVFSIFIDPMREELGLSLSGIAWAISIRMLTGGAAAPIMGRLIDSYGARWLGFLGGLMGGAVLICLYYVDNIWLIYALFAVSGISGFGTFGGQLLTIVPVANWFVAKRGRATSIAATGLGAGTALGVPLGLYLINTVGWRWAWVVFGVAIWVVILPGYAFLMRRRPEDLGLLPDGRQPQPAEAAGEAGEAPAAAAPEDEVNWTLGQAMRTPVLWFILLTLTVYMFSSSGVLFLRVPYWNELGVAAEHIALGVAADPFTVIFAMLLFGFLAERYPVRFMAVIGGIWRAISMVPLAIGGSHAANVYIHNVTWGIGSGAFAASQNLMIPNYYGRMAQGAIRGISLPLMIAAGALGAPATAYLVDSGVGAGVIWQIGLWMMLAAGIVFFFLKPPKPLPSMRAEMEAAAAARGEGTSQT
ncbi:MAG: MFS transporter [Chloroflexota bacterium]|nr:MFS transporter [Chloroflexota bacterium]MDE2942097.1 MFS transporter [Chloroflexota bacterium]MDE3268123.1 MFS transporter [Chloroflexota bacterium]